MYAAYTVAMAAVTARFAMKLGPLLRLFITTDRGPQAKKDFTTAGAPLIRVARQEAYDEAVAFVHKEAARAGQDLTGFQLPEISAYDDAALLSALDTVDAADGATAKVVLQRVFERHVEGAARDLIEDLADAPPDEDEFIFEGDHEEHFDTDITVDEADAADRRRRLEEKLADPNAVTVPRRRFKWARILTGGDNCGLCVMCAGRGPVYSSKRRAVKSNDPSGKYHNGCDCKAVPVFLDDFPAQEDAAKLATIYQDAQETIKDVEGTANDNLNRLRQYLTKHKPDLPRTAAAK